MFHQGFQLHVEIQRSCIRRIVEEQISTEKWIGQCLSYWLFAIGSQGFEQRASCETSSLTMGQHARIADILH